MIVVDTNIIVALPDKKDTHYNHAVRILEDLGDERVYILNVNLVEVYSAIARRCREGRYNCKDALGKLRELEANINVIWIENLDKQAPGELAHIAISVVLEVKKIIV